MQYNLSISTTQSITFTAYKPVYIKGKLNGTLFTPVSTAPLTQAVPISDDGYWYILLGMASSTTALYLLTEHPIFAFKNGSFSLISNYANTAVNDSANNKITSTYIKSLTVNGKTITITKGDNSTSTITIQDTNTTYSPPTLGGGYGTCATEAATVAKFVTLANYALVTGGICAVKFTNSVPNSATLNINGKGAKPIYYHNAAIVDDVIASGDTVTFIYDGAKYHVLSIDKMAKVTQTVENSTESVPTGSAVMAYTTKKLDALDEKYLKFTVLSVIDDTSPPEIQQ